MGPEHDGADGRQAPLAGQQGHGPQLPRRETRSRLHRFLHRRKDHRHDLCRQHPQGKPREGADVCRSRQHRSARRHEAARTSAGVEKDANEKSIEDILIDAGCLVGPSGCSACLGGPADTFGRLNSTEVCISTTNRNFPGRMGSTKSAVYLASPLTVAASALTGHVTDPREFVSQPIETGMAGVL